MKINNPFAVSMKESEVLDSAYRLAFKRLSIKPENENDPKKFHAVKYMVSEIMGGMAEGRVTPVNEPVGPTPNMQGRKLMRTGEFLQTYPKWCITDTDKVICLNDLLDAHTIAYELYIELIRVLKAPKKLIKNPFEFR